MAIILDNPDFAAGQLILDVPAYVSAVEFNGITQTDYIPIKARCAGVAVDSGGFMDGDSDADGDALSYSLVSDVSHGTLEAYIGGGFTYTPDVDFVGLDSFSYMLWAGCESSGPYSVIITIEGSFEGISTTDRIPVLSSAAQVATGWAGIAETGYVPISMDAPTIETYTISLSPVTSDKVLTVRPRGYQLSVSSRGYILD